jgi:trans-aconitate 2-methyltransferase
MWNPEQYGQYSDERSRPFFELVSQIPDTAVSTGATNPVVVDLGCGPGPLTAALASRWPDARVIGADNDPAMLAAADQITGHANLTFADVDLRNWSASDLGVAEVDVIVANAALQWDLDHRERLPHLVKQLRIGGYLAFQVPGNLDDPHHQAIRHLRSLTHWQRFDGVAALPERTHVSYPATTYLETLAPLSKQVNTWETSYVHILQGENPILEWVKGTGLRPVLNALPTDDDRQRFCDELAPMLREAYPSKPFGTPFPFRRVFVVAQRA